MLRSVPKFPTSRRIPTLSAGICSSAGLTRGFDRLGPQHHPRTKPRLPLLKESKKAIRALKREAKMPRRAVENQRSRLKKPKRDKQLARRRQALVLPKASQAKTLPKNQRKWLKNRK